MSASELLATHEDRAKHYIGSAGMHGADDNPVIAAELAKAEALLALADSVKQLAAAVGAAVGVPA